MAVIVIGEGQVGRTLRKVICSTGIKSKSLQALVVMVLLEVSRALRVVAATGILFTITLLQKRSRINITNIISNRIVNVQQKYRDGNGNMAGTSKSMCKVLDIICKKVLGVIKLGFGAG